MSEKKVIATVRYVDGGRMKPRRIELDDEIEKIADCATEMQVLATAAADEGWCVNKKTEPWTAVKPCGDTRSCDLCAVPHCEHDVYCHGTGFVPAGRKA